MQGKLAELAEGRPFAPEAYEFVLRALEFSIQQLELPRHLSGRELVQGIRSCALGEFGPMAAYVLGQWGVSTTRDFGVIVFDLVEANILAKTDEDSIEDFESGFEFGDVFDRDYYRDFQPHPGP